MTAPKTRIVLCAAMLIAPRLLAWPGPDVDATARELESVISAMSRPDTAPAERHRQSEHAAKLRDALIAAAPDDDRAPTWMLDQAADLVDRLAADGTEAAVLLGIPTRAQREQARQSAWEAMELVTRAQGAATRAVARLEAPLLEQGSKKTAAADAGAARAQAEQLEHRMSVLVDTEQGLRIPYYRGRAGGVLAALEPVKSAREDLVRVVMASIGQLPLATAPAEGARRTTLGAALLLTAEGSEGSPDSDKPLRQARDLFNSVVEGRIGQDGAAPDTGSLSPVTIGAAWMGLIRSARTETERRDVLARLSGARRAHPFVTDQGRPDALLALLGAEAQTRAGIMEASRDAAARTNRLAEAFAPLLELLTRTDLAGQRTALRPLVLAKLAAASDATMPLDRLDPLITFARAVSIGGTSNKTSGSAEARKTTRGERAEAIRLFGEVAERADAGELRPEALWERAVLEWSMFEDQPGQGEAHEAGAEAALGAVADLCMAARDHPDWSRAREAANKAVEMSRYTLARLSKDGAAAGGGAAGPPRQLVERAGALYSDALDLATELAPDDPDAGPRRLERARLLLEQAGNSMTLQQLDTILSSLEGVASGANLEQRRQADELAQAIIDRAFTAAAARKPPSPGQSDSATAAVARRAVQWAQQRRPSAADGYRLVLAEALLDAGDARALAVCQQLALVDPGATGLDAWRTRTALARAQRLGGDDPGAFKALRAVTDEIDAAVESRPAPPPAPPGGPARPPVYWQAWAEVLEILAAGDPDPSRAANIRLNVQRLQAIDPGLGSPTTRDRILGAAQKVGPGKK